METKPTQREFLVLLGVRTAQVRREQSFCKGVSQQKAESFGRQVRALESEPDPSTSHKETEATKEVYLNRVTTEKSSNPTVTLAVNTIPVTLHIDTQADVTIMIENILRALKKQASSSRQKRS